MIIKVAKHSGFCFGVKEAVKKAEQYLEMMGFSRSGLIEQLEFEGFTTEEATYAADQLGF